MAADAAVGDDEEGRWPKAKYKKQAVSARFPNGYEVRRVYNEEQEAALGDGWKDSPEGMDGEVPFGHQQ
jgi:hypothetical protein